MLEAFGFGSASIHDGARPETLASLRWELAFYEPWFLAFGICMAVSAIGYLHEAGLSASTVRRVSIVLTITAVLSAVTVLLAMMLHWNLDVGL
ncbi:hypothetical protein [Microlunatus soli]|uniref:Uncharacterized protein n=1 Tax=Microlunatus soli TaxID=630515 RepID=A0A1H1SM33_9ACTN|nr:hypothetical protein [Microlunatus soli]SDS49022.1 hypothetical protein SAMN04489812_2065 [Microlunatus soli]